MISVTSKNIDIGEGTKEYIDQKFSDLDKYFDRIQFIDVIIEKHKLRHLANLKIGIKRARVLNFKAEAENLREALDLLRDKAKNSLSRLKQKVLVK